MARSVSPGGTNAVQLHTNLSSFSSIGTKAGHTLISSGGAVGGRPMGMT